MPTFGLGGTHLYMPTFGLGRTHLYMPTFGLGGTHLFMETAPHWTRDASQRKNWLSPPLSVQCCSCCTVCEHPNWQQWLPFFALPLCRRFVVSYALCVDRALLVLISLQPPSKKRAQANTISCNMLKKLAVVNLCSSNSNMYISSSVLKWRQRTRNMNYMYKVSVLLRDSPGWNWHEFWAQNWNMWLSLDGRIEENSFLFEVSRFLFARRNFWLCWQFQSVSSWTAHQKRLGCLQARKRNIVRENTSLSETAVSRNDFSFQYFLRTVDFSSTDCNRQMCVIIRSWSGWAFSDFCDQKKKFQGNESVSDRWL